MADISRGPVSGMPGQRSKCPAGATCDDHPERPAVARIQGETDSFGCEYLDLCQECIDGVNAHVEAEVSRPRFCDWCSQQQEGVVPHRDFEEGLCGPVYQVCRACRQKEDQALAQELDEERPYFGFGGDSW